MKKEDIKTNSGKGYVRLSAKDLKKLQENAEKLGMEFPGLGIYYESPDIDCADVRHTAKTIPIVSSNLEKYRKFIFHGAKIKVIPPIDLEEVSDEEVREVQSKVDDIDRIIRTVLRMSQAWQDKKVFGSSLFNYALGDTGTGWSNAPKKFIHLPAYSFDTVPSDRSSVPDRFIQGDILHGIIYDNQEEIYEYWQRQDAANTVKQLDSRNILHIRDEVADSPDGRSTVAMLMGLVQRLQFAEKALIQVINRAGAPGLWAEIDDTADTSEVVHSWSFEKSFKEGKKIIQNHGKDTVIVAPSRIKLHPLDYRIVVNMMDVIDHYERRILYTIIARDFTEQRAQSVISQSARPGLSLLVLMARSEQQEIAEPFIEFWQRILDANGYEGWTVEITWRDMDDASEDQLYERAQVAGLTGAWTLDEIREIAEWEPLTDDQREELGKTIAPPTEELPEESPAEPTDEEEESGPSLIQQDAEKMLTGAEMQIADLLAMKNDEFLKLCEEKGLLPWNIKIKE